MRKIRWLGHAAFQLTIDDRTILFDPWITGNPMSPLKSPDEISKADLVLVSHDHADHGLDDAIKISNRLNATLVGVYDLTELASKRGAKKVFGGNIGGTITVDDVKIMFTPAFHTCGIGMPCGFLIEKDEFRVYHAGDTSYYSDMETLTRRGKINLALLPIGSTYTMGPMEAAWAVERLKPEKVIPCHYNTFPVIQQDPEEFKRLVENLTEVIILKPGEEITLD